LVAASIKKTLYEVFPKKNKYIMPCWDNPLKSKYSLALEVALRTSSKVLIHTMYPGGRVTALVTSGGGTSTEAGGVLVV
tara:strand:- start:346 stop:582 length:237 start_codon:yes stop_codon:yes gene_type:complete